MKESETSDIDAPGGSARLLAVSSLVVGGGSLVAFTIFLFLGTFPGFDLGLGLVGGLTLNAALCIAFFLQHSGMIRRATRARLSRFISQRSFGAVYSVVSGSALIALLVLWQESTLMLAAADGLYRWSLRVVFFVAFGINVWGTWALKSADVFGVRPLLHGSDTTAPAEPIVAQGPYRWVRHPLYSTILVMIWSQPDLTADRLLFNVLFSIWIVWGTVLEERDLVAAHGEAYREYQRRVPMLVPYRRAGA